MRFARRLVGILVVALLSAGCGDMGDDLFPSREDKRPDVVAGTIGPHVGQLAPDFTVVDSLGDPVTLSEQLPTVRAAVLYFTMWCPICDSHMSHMRDTLVPGHPDVAFFAVDYVSGSVTDARSAQIAHGFGGATFRVLVDLDGEVERGYEATMGSTIVIGSDGVVQMNEDYRTGANLADILADLQ